MGEAQLGCDDRCAFGVNPVIIVRSRLALHIKSLNVVLRLRRRMCGEACLAGAELKQRGYAPGFWAKGRTRGSVQSN